MKKAPKQFEKFANKKSNAAIKEQFKQAKRKDKKEKEAYFERKKIEARLPAEARPIASRTNKAASPAGAAEMPLNKYIAHAGVCGRREAADIVKSGVIKVNDAIVLEPGYKVQKNDQVVMNGKRLFPSISLVYILLNKPKDYLTTTTDPQNRKTVLELIKNATKERVYPVGRLDRNTTGVLLFTNDGELAQILTHPSSEVKKIYAVTLNRALTKEHFNAIKQGIVLEDGAINVDDLAYSDADDLTKIGIEIHSGKNRIVRRIFEFLGYEIKTLDRVVFAGLTKKNIERGKWRILNEKEIRELKYFNKSTKAKPGKNVKPKS